MDTNLILIVGAFVVFILAVVGFLSLIPKPTEAEVWPYRVKKFFFSKTEQEFMRLLNQSIDRQRFAIFPKVRLADIVEVTVGKEEYQQWFNMIKSKHVDFLIWDIVESKMALAIELDGKSHKDPKVIERDQKVNRIYQTVGLQLIRVQVGSSFVDEIEKIKQELTTVSPSIQAQPQSL